MSGGDIRRRGGPLVIVGKVAIGLLSDGAVYQSDHVSCSKRTGKGADGDGNKSSRIWSDEPRNVSQDIMDKTPEQGCRRSAEGNVGSDVSKLAVSLAGKKVTQAAAHEMQS